MKWFRHDTSAHLDEKLIVLRKRHGWEAIGVYWTLVGLCYESEGEIADYKLPIIFEANEMTNGQAIFDEMIALRLFTKTQNGFKSDRIMREIAIEKEWKEKRSEIASKAGLASAEKRAQAKKSTHVERPSTSSQHNSTTNRTIPTVPDLTNQDGSAKKVLTDDEAGRAFRQAIIENLWGDNHYADKTWDQGCQLSGDDRTNFMRKVRLVLTTVSARPNFAKKIYHEIAGLVNDKGAMASKLTPQEKQSREDFADNNDQND